jgi:methylated-DNA-[protein]-cysteine S-methyltransferase
MAVAAGLVRFRRIACGHGDFLVVVSDGRLARTGWCSLGERPPAKAREDPRLAPELCRKIRAALAGEPVDFRDEPIPEAPPFTLACRRSAQSIPPGGTLGYAELASRAGNPRAARAAGQAMRRNPVPIVVPCHRVVGRHGPGGFAGATRKDCLAVAIKLALLAAESGQAAPLSRSA